MTKRFTPRASEYTERLAKVQQQISVLKKKLAPLEQEERDLKVFLIPFYDLGQTAVESGNKEFTVTYSESVRLYMDQEKVTKMLVAAGRKVPQYDVTIQSFKVKEA